MDPDKLFQANLKPSGAYTRVKENKNLSQRYSDIEKIRKTGRTSQISYISGGTPTK